MHCGTTTSNCGQVSTPARSRCGGDDVNGIAVVIAQRVQAAAEPNEVLVSRTIVDLVAGSGIDFTDRGEHDLKGLPGRWRLFAAPA
jgi:class 3 adenylate cyclase